ncbi:ATP-binding protein [Jatrophihabitans sp.]|uniref:sensor histidine kinase n=1 Tax=Jatrophihabitans sp. TaxID=1932789 RepID=UPI0030C74C7D|nr:Two-component system, OmpR family, sensor histidine kinase KdpD [Jatrophihabitans sp.]
MTSRGSLRIYLGAAPGVGKTYAMLDEGARRAARGADVVIGFVETHGRAQTIERIGSLPVIPRRTVAYRDVQFEEMDVAAVLARQPEVVLVDELAHSNVPGSGSHEKRWQDIEELLEAGIDVLSTVNIQHLESLNDVVEKITGVPQRETVPDSVVRRADQVQLVDMTPEALRRRMAHGNIYPPERVDAALGNYFRPGNLTALRELALLWLADRVEEGLQTYRTQHGITGAWETRERVVVALTGGPEGEALIRRASRIAARTAAGDLIAVHVARSDGLINAGPADLESQRLLVESLGGSYHSLVGDNVPRTLLDFARSVDATQIVLGASRRRAWAAALLGPGTGQTVTRIAGAIDVHIISHNYAGRGFALPSLGYGLTSARRIAGLVTAALLLGVGTPVLAAVRGDIAFATDLSVYLLIVVITSLVGGFYPAVATALAGSLLLNYYFAPPFHTFTITDRDNSLALLTFVLVAVLVSRVVDLSARRSARAARSSAEAETLSNLAASLVRGANTPDALLGLVQETFAMQGVALLSRAETGASWEQLASVGELAPKTPADGDVTAEISDTQSLVLVGHTLTADDQRILNAFAAQVAVAYRQWELAAAASEMAPLAASERARTALLNAVSHDLRTPIASAKAAVSSLLAADVTWSEADRAELLSSADESLDRLTDLVTNLLDLSRLQAGVLPVVVTSVGLDEVIPLALDHAAPPGAPVQVELPADLPDVLADAGLLERVVANVVQNALRFSPAGQLVRITGSEHAGHVELRVIDRGPGIPRAEVDAVFAAFQRRDDTPSGGAGVGLGLAIARGFAEAMGGGVAAEETPGGGATLVIRLRVAAS